MTDFSFLSDTDDSAVDELISQTQDLCILEQISAINCSGFNDSDLPSELESRFRKLKSFPVSKPISKPAFRSSKSELGRSDESKKEFGDGGNGVSSPFEENFEVKKDLELESSFADTKLSDFPEKASLSHSKRNSLPKKKDLQLKSKSGRENFSGSKSRRDLKQGSVSSPSASSSSSSFSSSRGKNIFSPSKQSPKVKAKSKSVASLSPSPPERTGCFWCSPKKSSGKKNKIELVTRASLELDKDYELLADASVLSFKEQQKILKKALKAQEKLNRQAEKIVKLAKQASARMSFSGSDDDDDDDDDDLKL